MRGASDNMNVIDIRNARAHPVDGKCRNIRIDHN
jgi:hypothetical protein